MAESRRSCGFLAGHAGVNLIGELKKARSLIPFEMIWLKHRARFDIGWAVRPDESNLLRSMQDLTENSRHRYLPGAWGNRQRRRIQPASAARCRFALIFVLVYVLNLRLVGVASGVRSRSGVRN